MAFPFQTGATQLGLLFSDASNCSSTNSWTAQLIKPNRFIYTRKCGFGYGKLCMKVFFIFFSFFVINSKGYCFTIRLYHTVLFHYCFFYFSCFAFIILLHNYFPCISVEDPLFSVVLSIWTGQPTEELENSTKGIHSLKILIDKIKEILGQGAAWKRKTPKSAVPPLPPSFVTGGGLRTLVGLAASRLHFHPPYPSLSHACQVHILFCKIRLHSRSHNIYGPDIAKQPGLARP